MITEQRGPVTNAVIESAEIQFDRDIFLNPALTFKLATGWHQGTGGWVLCEPTGDNKKPRRQTALLGQLISEIMCVTGVQRWSELVGKNVRLVHEADGGFNAQIIGIGHIIDDRWFYFSDVFDAFETSEATS